MFSPIPTPHSYPSFLQGTILIHLIYFLPCVHVHVCCCLVCVSFNLHDSTVLQISPCLVSTPYFVFKTYARCYVHIQSIIADCCRILQKWAPPVPVTSQHPKQCCHVQPHIWPIWNLWSNFFRQPLTHTVSLSALEKVPLLLGENRPMVKCKVWQGGPQTRFQPQLTPLSGRVSFRLQTVGGGPANKHTPFLTSTGFQLFATSLLVSIRKGTVVNWLQKSHHRICVYLIWSSSAALLGHFILGLMQYVGVPWLVYDLHRNWGVRHGYSTRW